MSLYTFIMDYNGGTYISQFENSGSLSNACLGWAKKLKTSDILGFGEKSRKILLEQLKNEEIIPISDLQNCWCLSSLIRNNLALITIIETVKIEAILNQKSEI